MIETLKSAGKGLASLKLTVVLLGMLMFLVFAGTWAQIDMGIWSTLKVYFRSLVVWIPFQIFLPRAWNVPGALPFPGGYLLGAALFVNLVMAHAFRFKVTRKRAGILMIHFSLILLFVGEFVTGLFAEESRMTIDEGQTVGFAEDTREVELAIIDPADPETDQVVVIPQRLLEKESLIRDPQLPFEIQVEAFYPNSDLVDVTDVPREVNADRGAGPAFRLTAVEVPVVSGVEMSVIDLPTVFVSVFHEGEDLGTWMVPLYLTLIPQPQVQEVRAGDRTYHLTLRYKRSYKPYRIHLLDFSHDRYLGTDTPRNYSSRVRLIDPTQNEDREVLIWMNNPLRYRGETFYQASFKQGDTGTILQVVRNPGWLLPYVACTLGAIGLGVQFFSSLRRFLGRRRAPA